MDLLIWSFFCTILRSMAGPGQHRHSDLHTAHDAMRTEDMCGLSPHLTRGVGGHCGQPLRILYSLANQGSIILGDELRFHPLDIASI